MKIIDLSHVIEPSISVYSRDESPEIMINARHEEQGYAQKKLTLYTHTATHIDAPYHIFQDAPSLDEMEPDDFYGRGVVADCRDCRGEISIVDLKKYSDRLELADFLLILTGWYVNWKTPEYLTDFPVLTREANRWLLQFNLKGIGLDTISADSFQSEDLPNHRFLLKRNILIIENLRRLEELLDKDFTFSCLPLNIEKADGSPVRAVGIIS